MKELSALVLLSGLIAVVGAQTLDLNNDKEFLLNLYLNPKFAVKHKIYLFNLTNPEGFLRGEKPSFQEVGPYVYRQKWNGTILRWEGEGRGQVEYRQLSTYRFARRLSGSRRQDDLITTINAPFIGGLAALKDKSPGLRRLLGNLLKLDKEKAYVTKKVEEFLFGYKSKIIALGRSTFADQPDKRYPFELFGMLREWREELPRMLTVTTGLRGADPIGGMVKVAGKSSLGYWQPGSECDKVKGSDGIGFKPNAARNEELYLFSEQVCRAVPLAYEKDVTDGRTGLKALRFKMGPNALETPARNPNNACYCVDGSCPRKGLMDMSPCQAGTPIFLSMPHFLWADESVKNAVNGLSPNEQKHTTSLDISPSGVVINGRIAGQINIRLSPDKEVPAARGLPNMIFPLLYFSAEYSINDIKDGDVKRKLIQVIQRNGGK